jgi:very-short-patch-repair endonuclease
MKREGTERAKSLRRRLTDAERRFCKHARDRQIAGAKFRRQWPIGRYVADFVCLEACIIVEIDGGQHAESESDAVRTSFLEGLGYVVLRFWNNEVLLNTDGVLLAVAQAIQQRTKS